MAFWSKKKKGTAPPARVENGDMPAEETLIGPGWRLKGRVYGKGTVVFQQAFEGELEIQGRLTIDPSAAVKGMLPKNTLGRQMREKLRVYPGADHPHQGQNPLPLEIQG